jgi:hypothetical protein
MMFYGVHYVIFSIRGIKGNHRLAWLKVRGRKVPPPLSTMSQREGYEVEDPITIAMRRPLITGPTRHAIRKIVVTRGAE